MMLLAAASGGCTVGPDYAAPDFAVPAAWQGAMPPGLAGSEENRQRLADWWTTFDDPQLSGLIEKAISGNLDLKQAQARVREARARRQSSESGLLPTLDAAASGTSTRGSEETGKGIRAELYNAGFDARWELDIFGGVRRDVEAKEADLAATREDYNGALVSLAAETALNYVEMRVSQTQLAVAEENLRTQAESYDLANWRFQAGQATGLDLEQAGYNLENSRAQLPDLQTALAASGNRLAVLTGLYPGDLSAFLNERREIPVPPREIALGVPADLLRRRPDLRRAERQLAAQTARVGVATAELYPKLTLSGAIGLEALTGSKLFATSAAKNSAGIGLSLPIFNAGALRANIEIQDALQEQALLHYEAVLHVAVEETENAMVAFVQEQQRHAALAEAAAAAQNALDLAVSNYQAGRSDFRDVLESQRALFSFRNQVAVSRGRIVTNLIRLYKALGGGWDSRGAEG